MLQKRMFSSQLFHPFQTLWAPTCNLVQDIICLYLVRGSGLYQQFFDPMYKNVSPVIIGKQAWTELSQDQATFQATH